MIRTPLHGVQRTMLGCALAVLVFGAACTAAPAAAPAGPQASSPPQAATATEPKPSAAISPNAAIASPNPAPALSPSASPSAAVPSKPVASPAAAASPSSSAAAAQPTAVPRTGNEKDLILATTTSTQDSGLLDVLVPLFQQQTGYQVKTVSVGTGAALALGARGEADVVLVHAPASEVQWMQQGNGTERLLVMHNDFLIVGPPDDPAHIKGDAVALAALQKDRRRQERPSSRAATTRARSSSS